MFIEIKPGKYVDEKSKSGAEFIKKRAVEQKKVDEAKAKLKAAADKKAKAERVVELKALLAAENK